MSRPPCVLLPVIPVVQIPFVLSLKLQYQIFTHMHTYSSQSE
jgi:hypothetical protein